MHIHTCICLWSEFVYHVKDQQVCEVVRVVPVNKVEQVLPVRQVFVVTLVYQVMLAALATLE